MSKIYVPQETPLDLRPAEAFGDIVYLSADRRDDFFNIVDSEHNARLLAHLRHGLRNFNENDDYILVAGGSPYVRAAVFWILGHKKIRKLQFLRWDNRDMTYIPLTIQYRRVDNDD